MEDDGRDYTPPEEGRRCLRARDGRGGWVDREEEERHQLQIRGIWPALEADETPFGADDIVAGDDAGPADERVLGDDDEGDPDDDGGVPGCEAQRNFAQEVCDDWDQAGSWVHRMREPLLVDAGKLVAHETAVPSRKDELE